MIDWPVPAWHPIAVHFPLALTVSAAAALGASRLLRGGRLAATLAIVGTWNLGAGAASAVFALGTGLAAAVHLHLGDEARRAVGLHVRWALFAALALLLAALWRCAGTAAESRPSVPFLIVMALAVAALIVTGFLGGQNVYRYAVGVGVGR
jgi:uncharacterized membrane protein